MSDAPEWTTVATFSARYEAELSIQQLEGADVPYLVKGEEAGIWGPGFSGPTSRGIELLVPAEYADAAREMLEPLLGDEEPDDGEDEA